MQIDQILINLSKQKTFFKSEKEFQHHLSDEIKKNGFVCEKSSNYLGQKVDILVKDSSFNVLCAIQLRHKTALLSIDGDSIKLKNHGAQDQARYDFIKDIKSLENIKKGNTDVKGYAIFLTNDSKYWVHPTKLNSVDEDFLIYEGKILYGNLEWSPLASEGTKYKREDRLELSSQYKCRWGIFPKIGEHQNNLFKYLVMEI
ncbi:hypothetical protein [Rummeliibacillus stabekisii]|uniref:Uncharacterized protein n=1 Tax=Rummeliibacillus stabekisii TaxID=241244 RepID=A0A143HFW6_9BACL|nr:hypothetical protein [Rummeliibacillus stabekisii]AMX00376.1 hypothetical protein ATY39_13710 [Rummeliibacillus stabekisii]